MNESILHSRLTAGKIKALDGFKSENYRELKKIGIEFPTGLVNQLHKTRVNAAQAYAQDELPQTLTAPSIANPLQFLQTWLPGYVYIATAPRRIDDLIGIDVVGRWEDEQIVQGLMELTGHALPYGDYANVPFSSWNANFEGRTVVRFEEGLRVGVLEAARSSLINVDSAQAKREAALMALDVMRNLVGFYGFNSGLTSTYGFLNEPNLPAYVAVPNGASGNSEWSTKTFLEITRDIQTAIAALRTQSQDLIDPRNTRLTLAVASDAVDWLSISSDFGNTVLDWINTNYAGIRIVSAPELNNAHMGENVFYLYADEIRDQSSDGGKTWAQLVPTRVRLIGVHQGTKFIEEDYSNATAGVLLKRPFAVVRYYGI